MPRFCLRPQGRGHKDQRDKVRFDVEKEVLDLPFDEDDIVSLDRVGGIVDFEHVGEMDGRDGRRRTVAALPFDQQPALETAIQMGYYETPLGLKMADTAAEIEFR